eukprot:2134248-Rhodomonas_salina.1
MYTPRLSRSPKYSGPPKTRLTKLAPSTESGDRHARQMYMCGYLSPQWKSGCCPSRCPRATKGTNAPLTSSTKCVPRLHTAHATLRLYLARSHCAAEQAVAPRAHAPPPPFLSRPRPRM